ncbi:MAG: tryptophan--tRNA ligase [Bacteriovoracaceae bacterium]
MENKICLTGIKPTGSPHLGNYLGAIKPALENLKTSSAENYFFIADYHAHTSVKDPKLFRQYVIELAATWLACGLDPEKVVFYRQLDVPELFELNWLLACHTPKGDLNRAHAYKALVQENEEKGNKDPDHGVNMGLYTYPLLMSADILLFDANLVPVGKDQIQHVEIARSIAKRINQLYKTEVLVEPQEVIEEDVATIIGLDGRKMSKSYNNTIPLFCPEKKLKKLLNKITSDSTGPDQPKDPDSSYVYEFYKYFSTPDQLKSFRAELEKGISWGEAKAQLFEVVNDQLKDMRAKYNELIDDPGYIDSLLKEGGQKAREKASATMKRVRKNLLGVQ